MLAQHAMKTKKSPFILGSALFILLLLTYLDYSDQKALKKKKGTPPTTARWPDAKAGFTQEGRPIMNTFYQALERDIGASGMTAEADANMLNLWEQSWRDLGWEPRILNLDDAKKHPGYEAYWNKLQEVPVNEYDQYCYIRWLAVAASGGGWMSDYDVIPIRRFDPIFERFTVYDNTNGMGMPFLVAGNAVEWDNLAFALLESGLNHKSDDHWSDMLALMHDAQDMYALGPRSVVSSQFLLTGQSWTEKNCDFVRQYDAIHFCHHCFTNSKLREGERMPDRPKIARSLVNYINEKCSDSTGRQHNTILG